MHLVLRQAPDYRLILCNLWKGGVFPIDSRRRICGDRKKNQYVMNLEHALSPIFSSLPQMWTSAVKTMSASAVTVSTPTAPSSACARPASSTTLTRLTVKVRWNETLWQSYHVLLCMSLGTFPLQPKLSPGTRRLWRNSTAGTRV